MKPGADHFKLVRDAWLLTNPKQAIYPLTDCPNWHEADITRFPNGLLQWNYFVMMSQWLVKVGSYYRCVILVLDLVTMELTLEFSLFFPLQLGWQAPLDNPISPSECFLH